MEEKKQVKLNLTILVVGTLVVLALGIAIGQLLAGTKENVENSIMKENYNTSSEINENTVTEEETKTETENEVIVNETEIGETEVVEENKKPEENNKEQSTDNVQNVENTVKEINVDSKKVQNLYSYIEKFNYYEEELVYKTNKVELKDVSNQLKLLTIFSNLTDDDATEEYLHYSEIYPDGNQHLIYSKEVVENKAKEIYGPNVKIIHENASPYDSYTREYVNGSYECYSYEGGGDVPWSMSYSAILMAEESSDKLYIYDRYVHMVEVEDIRADGINYGGSYDIFTATDRKEQLAKKLNLGDLGYYNNVSEGLTENQRNNILIDKIDSYVDGGIKTFKHTFEKDKNGNYYWVSTEPVEE